MANLESFHAEIKNAQVLRLVRQEALTDRAADLLCNHPENYKVSLIKDMTSRMVVEIERAIVASKDEVYGSIQVPCTWFDHFKQHFWSRWWMPKRWLSKPNTRTIVTVLNKYNVCPHLKADSAEQHIQFLFMGWRKD